MRNKKESAGEGKVRMKDIAKMAGVSITTVSNIVHGKIDRTSAETAERVKKILSEYGYKPSVSAVMLAGKSSRMIGVLIAGGAETEDIIQKIEKKIYEQGYYMLLHFSDLAEENLEFLNGWDTEGVLILGISNAEEEKIRRKYARPLVSLETENADFQAGYLIGEYLIRCGHRTGCYLTDHQEQESAGKWRGLRYSFYKQGLNLAEEDYILIPAESRERKEFYKRNLAKLAFSKDALVFSSDYYAAEAMGYLHDLEIKIPEEISVAGVGGGDYAKMCRPVLTTVKNETVDEVDTSVEALFNMICGKETERKTKRSVYLIKGESVKRDRNE